MFRRVLSDQAARAEWYKQRREMQAERNRLATKATQNIAPIPDIVDYDRRMACGNSFRLFCETYFSASFNKQWSEDHLRVIEKIEKAVREGGLFAIAMPRGSGKTTLTRCAALWAILYGYRPFVCLIGASGDRAKELLLPIRNSILENSLLVDDFPDALYPLKCLENSSRRQLTQHCNGRLTHVHWGHSKIVFPVIDTEYLPKKLIDSGLNRSPSCGSVITATSLDANLRGQQHMRHDGSIIRPSLVLLDDPQTRESAKSPEQTRKRLELLNGDILGLAGPGSHISALMTITKIYDDDLADIIIKREQYPEWESECTKTLYAMPERMDLWENYFDIRKTGGKKAALNFYIKHREDMDRGALPAWPARYDEHAYEISAIQHAMNLRHRVGVEAFESEYQNSPVSVTKASSNKLTVDYVMNKLSGYDRGKVPPKCTKITMFIDIHRDLLYYAVCAWEEDFTGYVIDYGTFPEQPRRIFTMIDAPKRLDRAFPKAGIDGAIYAGLETLVKKYIDLNWDREGTLMRIDKILIDIGYKAEIAAEVKRRTGGSVVMLSKGVGITAGRKPMAEYRKRPGETLGYHWYLPNVKRTGQFPHVLIDVNFWKRFVYEAFQLSTGNRGALYLYGNDPKRHELFAEHIAKSESWVEVTGKGIVVWEWSILPGTPDNHWFDCMVGCAVGASIAGITTPEQSSAIVRRKKYTQSDLRRT